MHGIAAFRRSALRFGAVLALAFAISAPALAQSNTRPSITPMKSTPDQTVTATATRDVVFPMMVEYIAIKNECSSDLYFDLGGYDMSGSAFTSSPNAYSLRLGSSEAFSGFWRTRSIGVSPASGNTTSCTFTIVVGK